MKLLKTYYGIKIVTGQGSSQKTKIEKSSFFKPGTKIYTCLGFIVLETYYSCQQDRDEAINQN